MRPATDIARHLSLSACLAVLLAGCAAQKPVSTAASGISVPPAQAGTSDRREAAKAAGDALMNLHFFADGRGMHMSSGLITSYKTLGWTGVYDGFMRRRWGVRKENGRIPGLIEVNYQGSRIGVAGCAMCHSGKAAGMFIPGLGSKNIDPTMLATDLLWMQKLRAALTFTDPRRREVDASALAFAELVSKHDIGNLTQGLVPTSIIWEWFFAQAGEPLPEKFYRGAVKVPHFWGYAEKRKAGLFCNGIGEASQPGWIVGVELAARQKPETVRKMKPQLHAAESIFSSLLPPEYPFAINKDAAARGGKIFASNCRECHGSYHRNAEKLPVFQPPKWMPLEAIGTDSDRVDSNTPRFHQLVDRSPLNDLIKRNSGSRRGYLAPRLEGVWCRFPYLHNGSVPSIATLLDPPQRRPIVFSLRDAGERSRFDEYSLGLTLPDEREHRRLITRGEQGDRDVFDARRTGQSNCGHDIGTDLPEADKRALIEYLKTL